jgi:N-carbamoyl-L-amino-acid hydrolase
MEATFRADLAEVADALKLDCIERSIWTNPAVRFDARLNDHVRAAAARLGLSTRPIVSGAGHDAAYVARVAPTTMIFVPSAGGISHNEAESTSRAECAAGAQVLLQAVLAADAVS